MKPFRISSPVLLAAVVVGLAVAIPALAPADPGSATVAQDAKDAKAAVPRVTRAICVLEPRSASGVRGIVHFTAQDDGVLVEAEISGLSPGLHGFHVHEWGDLDCGDGMCTGGHFNPLGAPHGGPDDALRHAGDLGNVEAGEDGIAKYRRVDRGLALEGALSIVGRGLIVHAKPDDLKSQPTGDAGARVAAGVIGIADPAKKR
jgi:Cu-Zn family superoxide dismutase